jgi:hypothetical protein
MGMVLINDISENNRSLSTHKGALALKWREGWQSLQKLPEFF